MKELHTSILPRSASGWGAVGLLGLLSSVVVGMTGCSAHLPPPGVKDAAAPLGGDAQRARTYRLGIGDKVRITVFGEAALSGIFEVDAFGKVTLPLLGAVPATGAGADGLRAKLVERLSKGYLKDPKVTVEIAAYRPFYVHGEVRNAGEFQFKPGLSIRDAVAMAGGYTYRADTGSAVITRGGGESEQRVMATGGVPVQPGDNILIPERFF